MNSSSTLILTASARLAEQVRQERDEPIHILDGETISDCLEERRRRRLSGPHPAGAVPAPGPRPADPLADVPGLPQLGERPRGRAHAPDGAGALRGAAAA